MRKERQPYLLVIEFLDKYLAATAPPTEPKPKKWAESAWVIDDPALQLATLPLVLWKWLPHSERGIKPNIGRKS
eukprot:SAG11_NODE_10484_length_828_cov_1.256516_1_plen_73_part_10